MRQALFRFYAPAGKHTRVACASAGVTLVLCSAGVYAPLVPWLACFAAWWFAKCGADLVVQPQCEWQQALPVPVTLLFWTRRMAPWSLGWTGVVASLAMTSGLALLGVSSVPQWLGAFTQALCLIGFVPLASSAPLCIARERDITAAGLGLLISGGLIFPWLPWLLGDVVGAPIGFLLGGLSFFGACMLAFADGGESEGPAPPVAAAAQRSAWLALPVALAARRPRFLVVQRFFYFHEPAQLWLILLCAAVVLLSSWSMTGLSAIFWMLTSQNIASLYLGISRRPPLPAHLPVSRSRLCFLTFAPLAVLALCALGIESQHRKPMALLVGDAPSARDVDIFSNAPAPQRVRAPSLFWRATLGEPPLVPSASGDLVRAPSQRVFSGLPLRVYNPFASLDGAAPGVFNAGVSQLLRDEWHLDVTAADVEDAYLPRDVLARARRLDCPAYAIAGTCGWPWMWYAIELCLLGLIAWAMGLPGSNSSGGRRRWQRLVPTLFISAGGIALAFALTRAQTALDSYGPGDSGFFAGAVLLGELLRLCQRSPLLACSVILGLLAALYWNFVRGYRRAELWFRRDA